MTKKNFSDFGNIVDSCPGNKTEFTDSATRLGCGVDVYGRSQYVCVPNHQRSSLVEFCYKSTTGLFERGNCIEVYESGNLDQTSCLHFTDGCPENHFFPSDLYKFPACQRVNLQEQCFFADPACPNITTTLMDIQLPELSGDGTTPIGTIVGSLAALLFILLVLITVILWMRNRFLRAVYEGRSTAISLIDENRHYDITTCESPLLAANKGIIEVRETVVNEDPEEREGFVLETGDNDYTSEVVNQWMKKQWEEINTLSEDPSTVLTNNQRVVLYTLFLCCNVYGEIPKNSTDDNDVSMGDINVSKTLEELKDMELIRSDSNQLIISHEKQSLIMKSYIDDCLLSDIDKDFYLQVTSNFSVIVYEEEFIFNRHVSRGLQSNCPITLMRLLVEIQAEKIYDIRMKSGPNILPPNMEMGGISRKLRDFVLRWCRLKNIVDPIAWADNLPDEGIKRFYYGSTICPLNDTVIEGLYQNPLKSSILCTILTAEDYKISADAIKEKNTDVVKAFPSLYHTELDLFLETIEEMEKRDQSLSVEVENNVIGFKSEEVRHQVMCYFVTNCLITDEDFVKYINLSSVDSLLEYVRTWWYVKGENERCLFLPNKMEAAFIKALGLDAIRHVMVEKTAYIDSLVTAEIRKKVIMNVNVPEEILDWDYDARLRFIECTKKGTQTIHRARAMILGCAGAGKTTLLKRLQNKTLAELRNVTSTVGLEVYEDIFEVLRDQGCLRALAEHSNKEGKELLSIMDFGGQCAYYACHQVYLSRRAFYILVIDMSKQFKEKVDKKLCDQAGTMFTDWTYGEYLLFWMKSIHIYSAEDAPVILVGTHLDKTKGQTTETFYDSILDQLRYDEKLKAHLNRKRCFTLGIQAKDGQTLEKLSSLEKCIVSIAKEDRWKDSIPTDWAFCEATFKVLKSTNKLISLEKYSREYFNSILERNSNVQDVLKLFHEIGIILHFNEKSLSEIIILDIQWFVDAFKNIITDSNHVKDEAKNHQEWKEFDQTGYLPENFLKRIWKSMKFDTKGWDSYILQYMERLGLIAMTLDSGLRCMYVPCMNKRTFDATHQEKLRNYQHKTSVLVFRFSFLPWFVYFRLIASCLSRTGGKWRVLNDEGMCMFKNIAFFEYEHHNIALAVDNSSIQLQVFQHGNSIVRKEITLEIRDSIERLLNELTGSFHKKIIYSVGYQCSMNDVYREYDKCFVEEKEIRGKGHIVCPRHELIHQHNLWEPDFLGYWKKDCDVHVSETVASTPRDNFIKLYEEGLQKFHFKAFEKLTKVGRNAMQIYFDAVYPKKDLLKFKLSKATAVKKMFHLSDNQFERLCPTDKSDPSSQSFDVTMMYQMLRNRYPNLPQPTKGWGKTPVTGDESETDDVERIRIYRNQVVHEPDATSKLEKRDLEEKGRDLTQAIVRLSKGDPNIQHEMMNALKNPT
ncbi:uncharacterized protein LOC134252075 [Saccostrea cucullata]|uniref:uncharacterized protein LOC134252075 n=2 Tax=Saccostrea cuccullata TaxID=36930 RepID=UPI002ED2C13C